MKSVGNRKLFGLKMIMTLVDMGWKGLKLPFKGIIGFLPPPLNIILESPSFYGALGFTFLWYMIETFNVFSTIKRIIYDKISLSGFEKNIGK